MHGQLAHMKTPILALLIGPGALINLNACRSMVGTICSPIPSSDCADDVHAQAHLLMMVDKPGADLRMPGGLMEAAHRTWLASARNVRVSALHCEVSRLLGERGVPHTIEHLTDDQLFSVDIALAGDLLYPNTMMNTPPADCQSCLRTCAVSHPCPAAGHCVPYTRDLHVRHTDEHNLTFAASRWAAIMLGGSHVLTCAQASALRLRWMGRTTSRPTRWR